MALPPVKVVKRLPPRQSEFHTPVSTANIAALVASCQIDHTGPPSVSISGGRLAAQKQLAHFLQHGLARYAAESNQPSAHTTSGLSPYLHFGHISSLEVALAAKGSAEFLEQLIVRRELAFNFARFTPRIGDASLNVLPDWARETMRRHRRDRRHAGPPGSGEAAPHGRVCRVRTDRSTAPGSARAWRTRASSVYRCPDRRLVCRA